MQRGWYAVLRLWHTEDEITPGAAEWGEGGWIETWVDSRAIIRRSAEPFESEDDASKWAFANEIDGFTEGTWVDV